MKLDRIDIKMSNTKNVFFRKGNDVTCRFYFRLKTPHEFAYYLGNFEGYIESVAHCHPDDTFSFTKGKKIAAAKAEARAYRLVYNEIERRWAEVEKFLEDYEPMKESFGLKGRACAEHNDGYISRVAENTSIVD